MSISQSGPDLASGGFRFAGSAQYGDTFTVVGGANADGVLSNAVHVFDGEAESFVQVEGDAMSSPRFGATAFLVSSKIFREC